MVERLTLTSSASSAGCCTCPVQRARRDGEPGSPSALAACRADCLLARAPFKAFAGAQPDQDGLELGHHSQHVEQQPADRSFRSWTEPPRLSRTCLTVS